MKLCEYGCGREAKFQFKNRKWCCSDFHSKCPEIKKRTSRDLSGKNNPMYGRSHSKEAIKKMSEAKKGKEAWNKGSKHTEETKSKISQQLKGRVSHKKGKSISNETKEKISRNNGKGMLGKKHSNKAKEKISKAVKGNSAWNKGKVGGYSKETRKKMSISHRFTIKDFRELHPFFSQIEEMRYNPDKPGEKEIQVHCKNHLCPNSKEQNGWFTPSKNQMFERIRQLENKDGNGGSYFYCSEECKNICPLYGLRSDPLQNTEKTYTQEEYQQFREFVLIRDNYQCQYCGDLATEVHHERPQKLEPFFALDPDLAWSCCKKCHYKYGHKIGSECSTGNLANLQCI